MTDYGTITIVSDVPATFAIPGYSVAMVPYHYGTMTPQGFDFAVVPGIGSYALAGTQECPECPPPPGPPTDGQVWPLTYVQG